MLAVAAIVDTSFLLDLLDVKLSNLCIFSVNDLR